MGYIGFDGYVVGRVAGRVSIDVKVAFPAIGLVTVFWTEF